VGRTDVVSSVANRIGDKTVNKVETKVRLEKHPLLLFNLKSFTHNINILLPKYPLQAVTLSQPPLRVPLGHAFVIRRLPISSEADGGERLAADAIGLACDWPVGVASAVAGLGRGSHLPVASHTTLTGRLFPRVVSDDVANSVHSP